ncbi:MAG: DUF1080 domain-containing protein [Flavobacterium sp.]|nr:DUF1080 domain-containing protein [Pedobacter sp.]
MNSINISRLVISFTILIFFNCVGGFCQNPLKSIPLTDLTFSDNPSKNWQIIGNVFTDLESNNQFNAEKGTGILVNYFDEKKPGKDLLFNFQHGDIDLELDYMMAKSANSGIYLQGRYEIQLNDSWTIINPKANDNGGIYERWDESKPAGKQGFEGYSPRQNVSRAPGLWQHLKISFQAPRFSAEGKKTENARMLLVELNGQRIHEDVELSGPTRGALSNLEQALGSLRFQGDHGSVAFRNIKYATYDKKRPVLSDLKYAVYKAGPDSADNQKKLSPAAEGSSDILTSSISPLQNEFFIRYKGNLEIKEAGEYAFNLQTAGGSGSMRVADKIIIPVGDGKNTGKAILPAGKVPIEISYIKTVEWAKPDLRLNVAGPGIREFLISDAIVSPSDLVDPILINPTSKNKILRSFVDLSGGKRIIHAINVGSNKQVNYTYDADNGMIVQLWRGDFLDATPMWHDRGDGSSRAAGSVHQFGNPAPVIQKLVDMKSTWATDTNGTGFKPKGYSLDNDESPTFKYIMYGTQVTDATTVLENGQGIKRQIELQAPVQNLYVQLVSANSVEEIGNGKYLINDKSYYLQIDDYKKVKPLIRLIGEKKEILVPIQKNISYSILF